MGIIGLILSLIAGLFLLLGLLPFLGWTNWFTTLPIATLGAVFSGVATARRSNIAVAGLVISIIVIGVALVRLTIGGGIF
jgi:hypothetical protein